MTSVRRRKPTTMVVAQCVAPSSPVTLAEGAFIPEEAMAEAAADTRKGDACF